VSSCCACAAHAPVKCLRYYAQKIRSRRSRQGNEPIIMPWVPTPTPTPRVTPIFPRRRPRKTQILRANTRHSDFPKGTLGIWLRVDPLESFPLPQTNDFLMSAPLGLEDRNLFAFPGTEPETPHSNELSSLGDICI